MHGIAALTPTTSGEKAQIIVDDLQALASVVAPVAGNDGITLVAAPAQAVALQLRLPSPVSWPVLTSASLAAGTVIAVAANAVVSAIEGAPAIDASTVAAFHRDSVPAEIVTSGGAIASSVGSMFQTDEVALRMRWPISWALRASGAVAWMQGRELVIDMDEAERRRILQEARATLERTMAPFEPSIEEQASRFEPRVAPCEDAVARWRREAHEEAERVAEAAAERKQAEASELTATSA